MVLNWFGWNLYHPMPTHWLATRWSGSAARGPKTLLSKTGFDCLGKDQSSFRLSALSLFSIHQWIVAICGIHKWYGLAIPTSRPGHSVKNIVCMPTLIHCKAFKCHLKMKRIVAKIHMPRVDRVPGFLSVRPIWRPLSSPPQACVAPPPLVPGGDTLACGRGGGGSQFGRRDRHSIGMV